LLHLDHLFFFSGFVLLQLLPAGLAAGIVLEPSAKKLDWEVRLDLVNLGKAFDDYILEGRVDNGLDWVFFMGSHLLSYNFKFQLNEYSYDIL
jgi:hypothetical protein